MKQSFSDSQLENLCSKLQTAQIVQHQSTVRNPIHVVYGGANLFKADTPNKLGKFALKSLETYAPNFIEFARAIWLKGADTLPKRLQRCGERARAFEFFSAGKSLRRDERIGNFGSDRFNG